MPRITAVKITDANHPKLKAFATVSFDNCFVLRGLKIVDGCHGLFVAMPVSKQQDGIYSELAYPLTTEFNQHIEEVVLSAYHRQAGGAAKDFPAAATGV